MNSIVSIITPVYNSQKYLEKTINSVLKQTYTSWELILIDDCSSDKSRKTIKKFAQQDERIKLITLKINSGAAIARNVGIEVAIGRYIAFLDDDDVWVENKLLKQKKLY